MPFDGSESAGFGISVAAEGGVTFVGAWRDEEPGLYRGSVYIYNREEGLWSQVQKLTASDGVLAEFFGVSVAISGDWAVVGAPRLDIDGVQDAGGVYIYRKEGNLWVERQRIVAPQPESGAGFGQSADIDGERIVVGQPEDLGFPGYGAAFVFEWSEALQRWRFDQRLQAPDPVNFDFFGRDVAIDGDHIGVTSARLRETKFQSFDGLLYFYAFDSTPGHWKLAQRFHIPEGDDGGFYDRSLGIDGNRAAAGFPSARDSRGIVTGAAYYLIYDEQLSRWEIVTVLTPETGESGDEFGWAVALGGTHLIVANRRDDLVADVSGAGYVYDISTGFPDLISVIVGSQTGAADGFFTGGAIENNQAILGSAAENTKSGSDAGAAYVFSLTGECGEAATLSSITTVFGQHLSGDLSSVLVSDDAHYRVNSQPGFAASEPNLVEVRLRAQTGIIADAETIFLTVEGRLNNPGGTGRLRLRNWMTNAFQTVHTYTPRTSDHTTARQVSDPAPYIRASDGRIDLAIRQSVIATFSVTGFRSLTDYVRIGVE